MAPLPKLLRYDIASRKYITEKEKSVKPCLNSFFEKNKYRAIQATYKAASSFTRQVNKANMYTNFHCLLSVKYNSHKTRGARNIFS
jgi:hypothetical protein